MKNILFVAGFKIDENKGGVQRVTALLSKGFINQGIGVTFLALKEGNVETIDAVNQYYIPNSTDLNDIENIAFINRLIDDFKIDIVINQCGILPEQIKLLKAAQQKRKFKLITVHHNCIQCLVENYRSIVIDNIQNRLLIKFFDFKIVWEFLKIRNKIKYGRYFNNAIAQSDKFVVLSDKFIPELKTYIKHIDNKKIIAINNPLSFSNIEEVNTKKDNALLYVGRINGGQKRSEKILEIWKNLYSQFPDWRFDVVGDGPLKNELEKKAKAMELERIYFHGIKDPKPFYSRSKIFCLTSDFEGFGMVLAEAQIYGVVPIAINAFSVVEDMIEDGGSGIIVEKNNMEAYCMQIQKLIGDPVYLQKLSERGKEYIQKYNLNKITNDWLDLFKDLNNP